LGVELQIEFTSRRPGSFGLGIAGRTMEWLTTTWFRFTCLAISAIIIMAALSANMPFSSRIALIVFAPIAATFYWFAFLFLLLICRYLGTFGRVFANVLVIYFYLFSRLVVQPPPKLWLPLTIDR
jgi:hypothetical protein